MKKIAINTTADDDAVVIITIKLSRARPAGKKACMMTMVITNNAKLIIIIVLLYQYLFLITGPKIRFALCRVYQNMSFPTHVWQRIGQSFCKIDELCRKFYLSYAFPTCMKSEVLSIV